MILISSLQLKSAFHAVKQCAKGLTKIASITGTVAFAQFKYYKKEHAALHEAAHAVIAEHLEPNSIDCAKITGEYLGKYSGEVHANTKMTWTHLTSVSFAGFAQDLKQKELLDRTNFMEQELGLPLSNVSTKSSEQLQLMKEDSRYSTDLALAYRAEHRLHENNIEIENNLIRSLKKTKKLVEQNQTAIHAVAEVLCDKEELFGDEIREIIKVNSKN